jgi:protein O-mannosyl-transferase
MAKRSKRKSAAGKRPVAADGAEPRRFPAWLAATMIVVAVFWVYAPVLHGDWLWDDDWYITNQPLLRTAAGLWKFWFQPGSWIEYYPLEETLLWVEWHLWGTDTLGYHLVTTALHAANALLVWRLLARLGLRKAWLGGLIFAVHPAAVDSVAWIVETKNTLSLLPCLLTMIAWVDYEETRRRRDYACALAFFLAAMLCKIEVAPLPVVLLLYAWWKRGRLGWRDIAPTLPFFGIALILFVVCQVSNAIYARHPAYPPEVVPHLAPLARFVLAGESLTVFFTHLVWPVGLLPVYPQWTVDPSTALAYPPWLAIAVGAAALWWRRRSWGRTALLGMGVFVLFLAPFLGFLEPSYMSFTWIMDHFLYFALIGPIGLVVAAVESIENRLPASRRIAVTAGITLVVGLLALTARGYAAAFSDEATLWGYTVDHNPGNWLARDNYAKALLLDYHPDKAEEQFRVALLLHPGRAQTHLNLGRALVAMDRVPEGLAEYDTALALDPSDPEIYNQKGVALLQAGRKEEALAQLEKAIELRPRYAIALDNLGIALALSGRLDEAVTRFNASIQINPDDPMSHVNLGRALRQLGRSADADAQFRLALQLDPGNAAAKAELAATSPSGTSTAP